MSGKLVLTACSNARKETDEAEIEKLKSLLEGYGLEVIKSRYLYEDRATGKEKADELSAFFSDEDITAIFDVSGGNVANELLPYLDYEVIAKSQAIFWGYSDLTTIINAIYAKTGKASMLYQVRHLLENEDRQLTKINYHFLQGEEMSGVLVGGNLRCFLKLAGTEYMPELTGKVFLMEALGGDIYSVRTMLASLEQIGVFRKIKGIVVGTFTSLMREGQYEDFLDLLRKYVPKDMPIAVTGDIGHGKDAKGILIGREIRLLDRKEDENGII